MNTSRIPPRARIGLLVPLVLVIIVLDQLSKAWFVYKLGTHTQGSFGEFAAGYFSLWGGNGDAAAVTAHYFPFKPGIALWPPWIEFNLTTNTGAAWSMFTGNSFVLSGVSLLMAALLFYVWWRSFRYHLPMTLALGGIIGGALGNFVDRFRLREVVDFIDVRIPLIGRIFPHLGDPYDFPIFNVADSCAVIGTLCLAIYLIIADFRSIRRKRELATHDHEMHMDSGGMAPPVEPRQVEKPAAESRDGIPDTVNSTGDVTPDPAPPAADDTPGQPLPARPEPTPGSNGEADGSKRS